MLNSIFIRNFQIHEKKRVDLNPGITVITGSSDTGKSAIIRAIEWVRTNRPRGTSFLRFGADECSVVIRTDHGKVKRFRTKQENGYQVNETNLVAVGSSVPSSVTEVLRLSDLNIQMQHDPPFLLTKTPGEVGRALNEYADLSEVDALLQELNRRATQTKKLLTEQEASAKSLKDGLKAFASLPGLIGKQEALYELDQQNARLNRRRLEVAQILTGIKAHEQQTASLKDAPTICKKIERLEEELQAVTVKRRQVHYILSLLENIKALSAIGSISIPTEKLEKLAKLCETQRKKKAFINSIEECAKRIVAVSQDKQEAESELRKMPKEAICPTCGSVVKVGL